MEKDIAIACFLARCRYKGGVSHVQFKTRDIYVMQTSGENGTIRVSKHCITYFKKGAKKPSDVMDFPITETEFKQLKKAYQNGKSYTEKSF